MSVKLMSAIFETEFPDTMPDGENGNIKASTAKLVLLAIADHANDEGESAYPGLRKIERKTGLSRQSVINAINALKYNGILTVSEERSKLGTNDYSINTACFPCLVNPLDHFLVRGGVKPLYQGGKATLPGVVKPLDHNHPLTIINHQQSEKINDKTPLEWMIRGDVSPDEIERVSAKIQAQKEKSDAWERVMGYNPLNWNSPDLEALLRFLMDKSVEEMETFAEWSRAKYSSFSPVKARMYPRKVIELWPLAFLGDEPDPRTDKFYTAEDFE